MNSRNQGCPGGCQSPTGPMPPKFPQPLHPHIPRPPQGGAQPPLSPGMAPPTATLNVFSPEEGFVKGTMFRGIYRPYKNYTPRLPTPPDEKSAMMQEVNKYAFAAHDILLYLDNFPNDQEAINLYNRFMEAYLRARDAYEERFGAITTESDALKTAPFSWTVGGWPWVRGT